LEGLQVTPYGSQHLSKLVDLRELLLFLPANDMQAVKLLVASIDKQRRLKRVSWKEILISYYALPQPQRLPKFLLLPITANRQGLPIQFIETNFSCERRRRRAGNPAPAYYSNQGLHFPLDRRRRRRQK
jgi:hypothetical protein